MSLSRQKFFVDIHSKIITHYAMQNKHKYLSTFDKFMQDPKWADFEKGYEKFLLSEFKIDAEREKTISRKMQCQNNDTST